MGWHNFIQNQDFPVQLPFGSSNSNFLVFSFSQKKVKVSHSVLWKAEVLTAEKTNFRKEWHLQLLSPVSLLPSKCPRFLAKKGASSPNSMLLNHFLPCSSLFRGITDMKSLIPYTREQWCHCSCDSLKTHGTGFAVRDGIFCQINQHRVKKKDKILSEKVFFFSDEMI